ncbi:MAG: hypothetical protein ACOWWR_17405 [Eubacteriales bacterium]
MNVDVFDEVMLFDGKTLKVNDRILYSFNEDLPERFRDHLHIWFSWIQAYIDDFLKGKEIAEMPYNEPIHYDIVDSKLWILTGSERYHILYFGTEKTEVRRVIAIGAFESYLATV